MPGRGRHVAAESLAARAWRASAASAPAGSAVSVVAGGGITGGAGAAGAGGFLGIIQDMQEIRNLASNAAGLRASVDQLQAAHEAGRIDRFQVDLARQALYNAESRLLTNRAAYQSRLDGFKIDLGLPPNVDLRVDDPVLDQFQLLDPALTEIEQDVSALLADLRGQGQVEAANGAAVGTAQLEREIDRGLELGRRARVHMQVVLIDYDRLTTALPTRRKTLRQAGPAERSQPLGTSTHRPLTWPLWTGVSRPSSRTSTRFRPRSARPGRS